MAPFMNLILTRYYLTLIRFISYFDSKTPGINEIDVVWRIAGACCGPANTKISTFSPVFVKVAL